MSFDQFANQGGAAAGDEEEAAAARREAAKLLKESAPAANAAEFGGGPLGSLAEEGEPADEPQPTEADQSVE